jgi:uncharacterized protein YjgD (DUF1641 family)
MMAEALKFQTPKRDPVREELIRRLETAPAEHAAALLSGLEVIQALHDRGVLEVIKGALGSGDQVLEIIVRALNTPEAIRAARNAMILAKVLGSIEPTLLEKFASAMPDALIGAAKAEEGKAPGFWGIVKIFRSDNLRQGLAVVNNLLEAWGRNFACKKNS